MDVQQAIMSRKSTRAFLDKAVPKEQILQILEFAKQSASSTNTQTWEVCVVSGEQKRKIDKLVLKAFDEKIPPSMEYEYSPKELKEVYKLRQKELGKKLYGLLQIPKSNSALSIKQWRKNYDAFNAPCVVYMLVDKSLKTSSFIDCGIFINSFVLMATSLDLATCIQASLAQYPKIVKQELNISDEKLLVCGIALGYEDKNDIVNSFKSDRISIDEFAKFYE